MKKYLPMFSYGYKVFHGFENVYLLNFYDVLVYVVNGDGNNLKWKVMVSYFVELEIQVFSLL